MWQQGYAENLNESSAQQTPFNNSAVNPRETSWASNATDNILSALSVVREVGKTYVELKNGGTNKPAVSLTTGDQPFMQNPNPIPFDYLGKLFVKPAQANEGVSSSVGAPATMNWLIWGIVAVIVFALLRR